ncbi:MAG TPA: hypothetical protein VGX68_07080 [Thermoanaerobaculia bacterium]|jgi:hypothetical protein|nr:hypothetical protein [Thermoanaerobaculia bacterium]
MAWGRSRQGCCVLLSLVLGLWGSAIHAEQKDPEAAAEPQEEAGTGLKPRLDFGLEAKANFRNSERNRFPVVVPPSFLPPGQTQVFEETVSAGSHFELSDVTLFVDAVWGDGLAAHGKVDFIDLYDRNPTSGDKKVDVDEAWLRFGVEPDPATLPARGGVYLKVGKLPKFERQDDRHLESYGLVSTAFNRFEDAGAELGVNLGRHFYAKLSATQGNPVFIRDPNALAGDNGTPERQLPSRPNTAFQSGVVILYDAEIEDVDVDGKLETGAGIGYRFADEEGRNGLDVLAWGYQRKLAQTVDLEGTFYGGDIDVLNGPFDVPVLPIKGDDKEELGANVWLYLGGLSFFGQYVDQELAGLPRTGIEAEVAWRFELPLVWAVGERQLFTSIAPAVRYSKLDNDFRNQGPSSAPSLAWDWEKIDAGLRLGIFSGVDLTMEYADNRFILGSGAKRENNEFLATLRWRV